MTAAVKDPVIERNMSQFREGSLGLKFSPRPMYLYIGFGGLEGFKVLGSSLISGLTLEEASYSQSQNKESDIETYKWLYFSSICSLRCSHYFRRSSLPLTPELKQEDRYPHKIPIRIVADQSTDMTA